MSSAISVQSMTEARGFRETPRSAGYWGEEETDARPSLKFGYDVPPNDIHELLLVPSHIVKVDNVNRK